MLQFLMMLCRFNFGTFEKEEFKKFLYMGLIFALIVGVYWTLRPLRDAIFIGLVDKMQLPYAKTVSLLSLLPIVGFYTRLLERKNCKRMLIILPAFYGVIILCAAAVIMVSQGPPEVIASRSLIPLIGTKILGYSFYVLVDSFGSLAVALFWTFAADTTSPESAKKGFPLIIAMGQIGGILFPYSIGGLPHRLALQTDALAIVILSCFTLSIIPLVRYFLNSTPEQLLISFRGKNQDAKEDAIKEVGFLGGLKLIASNKYLAGIFIVNFIYDFIVTIFDFNFKIAASTEYAGVALTNYLSTYGSSVNALSLFCLLFGISNISRFLGIRTALAIVPILIGLALLGFLMLDSLSFLYALMVFSKAINYSLNGPALKQLYIPVTKEIRLKAQGWIETFGSRGSKEASSLLNMLLGPLQSVFGEIAGKSYYLMLSSFLGFPMLILWFLVALYLGKRFNNTIYKKENIIS